MARLGLVALVVGVSACQPAPTQPGPAETATTASASRPATSLAARADRFAPADIGADVTALPENERTALAHLITASRVIDGLFLRQVWAGNPALLLQLQSDKSPEGQARLRYFLLNKGPWSRLDGDEPFVAGVGDKPEGANFYPAGATKADIEHWLATLSPTEKAQAVGFFTTIRRGPEGRFVAVPYTIEYQGELALIAEHLRAAAKATSQPTLRVFLDQRADALVSNDYYASDVAWMELDASIEPTIGPYEVYEDEWFAAKAAFESFITLRDDAETAKLTKFSGQLQGLENRLPIDPALRNPKLGALSPIRVVNVVFSAGDGNRGVQTAAFNLPNDERVVNEKGTKRTMLKNTQEAKFRLVLQPIAKQALSTADQGRVQFDAFFTHILMHELMHGLGPNNVTVNGQATTVRAQLKETYSTLEEAKADISGLWALQTLVDDGVIDKSLGDTMYVTFLASAFRSIRFGTTEAHGRGIAIQLNALLDAGAFVANADGTFRVEPAKIRDAVKALTTEIMMVQARGDYAAATALMARRTIRPEVQKLLDRLGSVPVDIEPRFTAAEQLMAR
jgi:Peptidase family M49